MQNQQLEAEMTAEELAQKKEEMLNFYTESLPYLEAQFKYEEMLMKLDEVRFKRTNIQMQFAMMMQGPSEEELAEMEKHNTGSDFDLDKESEPAKGKKLKRS